MPSLQNSSNKFERLRRQAAELLQQKTEPFSEATTPNILDLIHELQIHQVELEIQNEELQRAQHEISALEKEYKDLYEFAPCGYLTLNEKGLITRANLTAVKLLDKPRSFLLNTGFSQYVVRDWEAAYIAARKKTIATRRKETIELPLKRKDGNPIWIRGEIEAELDENDVVGQYRMLLADITAQHKAEEEKKQIEDELRQAQKMESIGTIAGGIAHDFNNILYMIIGNAELALEELDDLNPAYESINEIKHASFRASAIVKQLLNFSRKTNEEFKNIGAVTIINQGLKFIRSILPTTIEIKTDLPDHEIAIKGDPVMVNQMLINLFTNAAQAIGDSVGWIEINVSEVFWQDHKTCRESGDSKYLQIIIKDSGPGINQKIIGRIFDPYFTTKDIGEGSGLGLSVVHGIVENHKGKITADSPLGEGAVFTILIPVVNTDIELPVEVKETPIHGNETILFVDDEEAIVELAAKQLKMLGYSVDTCLNPVEAMDQLRLYPDKYNLVITDVTMPKMTGINFYKRVKQSNPEIPFIICTGHSSLIDKDKAVEHGFSGFLMKPVSITQMAKTIRRILDGTNRR